VLDLGELATEVISAMQEPASHKQQQLVYHTSPKPALVTGDLERMRQVLTHLVENALKYTLENGHISAIVRVTEAQVLFKIEDDGLGITPADLPFIFDKFYRVEDKDRSEIQGAGLGLAICKSVIEKCNGSIWAESEYHRGSTFTFSLPLAMAEVTEASQTPTLKPEVVPVLGSS
jgi:signal transduction histidine kinase